MVTRLMAVREREYMLVDTLNEYYAGLYYDIAKPYPKVSPSSNSRMLLYDQSPRKPRVYLARVRDHIRVG